MKFKMFSVIVGTECCIASCPFCVSGVKPNKENLKERNINWRNLKIAGNLANRSGIDTVMLTSRGEPTLFPEQITEYLKHLKEFQFPFVELQSNCIPISLNKEKYEKYLKEWKIVWAPIECAGSILIFPKLSIRKKEEKNGI